MELSCVTGFPTERYTWLVQEKRRVSFMYFCTHENINVFISTDRSSFPNNKISIFTVRPPHIKHIQFNESCLSYLDSYQTEADLEGARGVCAPPPKIRKAYVIQR